MKTVSLNFHSSFSGFSRKVGWGLLALTLGLAQSASALVVGSGNVTTEKREVKSFHAVDLAAFGNVTITQGDSEDLTIEGEDNLIPLLKTEVDDKGVLHLGLKSKEQVRATKPLLFKVSAKALDRLVLAGSGNIESKTLKASGNFDVLLAGSGNIAVDGLTAGSLKLDLQGSGNVRLNGGADSQKITVAGSGDYEGAEFKTKTTELTLSGSGDCEVWTTDKLKVGISGSGDVSYYGKPTVEKKVSGSGDVEALGAKGQ